MIRTIRILCLVYLLAMSWFLLSPDPFGMFGLSWQVGKSDIWGHFAAFVGLALLMRWAEWPLPGLAIMATLVAYAVGTELVQFCVPHRMCELRDLVANTAGIVVGWWAFAFACFVLRLARNGGRVERVLP